MNLLSSRAVSWLLKGQVSPFISSPGALACFLAWFGFVFRFVLFGYPGLHDLARVFICFETFLNLNGSSSMGKFPGRFLILALTELGLYICAEVFEPHSIFAFSDSSNAFFVCLLVCLFVCLENCAI